MQWSQGIDCCTWSGVECDVVGSVIGLDLSEESISGGIENSTGLYGLQHLQSLNLAFNQFNASKIPSGLAKLTNLTYLNLSDGGFAGQIPFEISSMTSQLYYQDTVTVTSKGSIPSSIGKLGQLESLDLSVNNLSGEIPTQLASLNFLSFLNLSYNHLVGKIPSGTQLQSFTSISFEGNEGLYGPPLTNDDRTKSLNDDRTTNSNELPAASSNKFECDWHS
ncbi:hypothetical protein Ddye_009280 [Dipteronia dyeriana]|uniref:Leucine-rich repeat-containing N-terminal plant-type domain-containing protein n=1 Tax=Dipteronia dyeriana TaxID=168575 RepID=A0AAD9XC31_9ROSI|nr:hypothetical protein Ddye_009280 [Dipteronia dyeriana]